MPGHPEAKDCGSHEHEYQCEIHGVTRLNCRHCERHNRFIVVASAPGHIPGIAPLGDARLHAVFTSSGWIAFMNLTIPVTMSPAPSSAIFSFAIFFPLKA